MSWLNNSLNTIKGQLTNLAQEVLADTAGPGDDEYRGDEVNTKTALELLTETQLQKEQLDKACEDKDREIAALRKQITTLKSRKISEPDGNGKGNVDIGIGIGAAKHNEQQRAKLSHAGEEQNVEDSWCWEPAGSEASAASAAAAATQSSTGNPGDMVDVSLGSNSSEDVTKLNARIEQLEEENGELRNSLEELDAQHDQAMQDVLEHKAQLLAQLTELKAAQTERLVAHELAMARLQTQLADEQQARAEATAERQQLQQRVEAQAKELQQGLLELADMQQLLEKRGQDNAELIERVRQADGEREKLQRQLDELAKQVKEKKTSESSNSSVTGKHSEDEFIVVRNADAAGSSSDPDPDPDPADTDTATAPPSKEKLRDKLVSLEARIAELSAANVKLQDAELERQLASSVLGEQLSELETRLRISESEKEQLQLELQRKLQQLMLQNQELKLSAEADQETHANDLEQQLGALRAENRKLRQELDASIAQAKFRQAIAEEKQEITDLDMDLEQDTANLDAQAGKKDPQKLRQLLEALLAENSEQALERTHRLLNERWQRLDSVEQRMVELQDQQMIAEHDKKTLEADISQYILQCDELMKNNELLLNELDKFKRNKLETIEEHHEETIAQLEQQLEEAQAQLQQQQQQLQQQQELQQLQQDQQQQHQHLEVLAVARNAEQLQQVEQLLVEQTHELQQSREYVDELLAQLTNLKLKLSEAQAAGSQVEQLQQQLQQLQLASEEQSEELQAALLLRETQLRESQELKEELQQIKQEQQQQQAKNELQGTQEQQKELQQLQAQLEQLQAQLEQLQAERDQCSKEHSAEMQQKQQQLEQQQQQIKEQQQQLEQQQQQLEQQQQDTQQSAQVEQLQLQSAQQLEQLRVEQQQATAQLQQTLETLNQEKLELIKALQQKHTENTQYYAEIQRLQPLEQQWIELGKEREKLCDQINFLKEKSDILTNNLLTEQANQRQLQQQQLEAQEQQLSVQRDLERLRAHLVEIEEMHTQETLELQRELEEASSKLAALQQEVSKSSTAYTSASIRANQQAETLQAQHVLLLQQRDELLAKLGQYEDRELKQQAALTNLQCALEQFQNDKEHDIELAMQRMRRELQQQLERETALRNDVAALQQQLSDANQGIRAAARLSDQLEAGQQTIAVLRDEVDSLKDANSKLEQRLSSSESSQTDKIDKSLIKSLLIGYVVSGHAGDKQQVLRMISSVLDFNAQEADKVGLNKPQSSWLGSILGSASNAVSGPGTGNDNLLQAFVQFLEQESQPQTNAQTRPTLLSMGKQVEASPATNVPAAMPIEATVGTAASMATTPTPAAAGAAVGGEQTGARSTTATPPTPPMQSLLMNSNEFVPTRNSSSILKDILNDS